MQDREHGPAVTRGAAQQFHHHQLMPRIERGRGFIGEQHGSFRGKRARQRDARPLAAGQRGDAAVGESFGCGSLHRADDRGAVLRRRRCERVHMRMPPERDHRGGLHRPMEYVALRQIGDGAGPLVVTHDAKLAPADHDLTVRRQ